MERSKTDEGLLLYLHNYSFYSQKVLLAMNEKQLSFTTKFVNIASWENMEQWYLDVNPLGEVPVIKDGSTIVPDSLRIINYLEEKYSNEAHPHLIPTDQGAAVIEKHNHLHVIIHDLPADVFTIGSFYHTDVVGWPKMPFIFPARRHMKKITEAAPEQWRKVAAEKTDETLKKILLKKADRVEEMLKAIQNRDSFLQCLEQVDQVLTEVENQLQTNKDNPNWWLFGEKFTLADVGLAILLTRLNILGLEGRYWTGGKRPLLQSYFDRVRQREAYKKSIPSTLFHIKSFIKGITFLRL